MLVFGGIATYNGVSNLVTTVIDKVSEWLHLFDTEDEENEHPNGTYEDASYHGRSNSGKKNKAPQNGQEALDNSVQVKDTSDRRVGVSEGEIVVLDKTQEGLYHGHVRDWDELTDDMRNALTNAGLTNRKGKILP